LPVHVNELLTRIRHTTQQLGQTLTRAPTPEEIAAALNISVGKVRATLRAARPPASLETPVSEDGANRLCDFIADDQIRRPEETAIAAALRQELHEALACLPKRERQILELRYLSDKHTLEAIGGALGLTRERVRQIAADALRTLRDSHHGAKLRDYLD
jgi:RNA polymerase primary sigma factor